MVQAGQGLPCDANNWQLDAETLATKCVFHGCSCVTLAQGTPIVGLGATVLDVPSIHVLARATMESFLIFHHLFVATKDDPSTRDLRHACWVLADLLERQRVPATLPESKEKLNRERATIEVLRKKISAHPTFQSKTAKQQAAILNRGKWRADSWTAIGRCAGLGSSYADRFYAYLCSSAHSGSLSVLQLRHPKTQEDRTRMLHVALGFVNISLAMMTRTYPAVFPKTQSVLDSEANFAKAASLWVYVGTDGDARVERGVGADEVRDG